MSNDNDPVLLEKLDGQPLPPAIRRLIDEFKANEQTGVQNAYNRVYSRHNRS